MTNDRLYFLLAKYFDKNYTTEEKAELMTMIADPANEKLLKKWIEEGFEKKLAHSLSVSSQNEILGSILAVKLPLSETPGVAANLSIQRDEYPRSRPVHRIHLLRTAWFRYAAAVVLIAAASFYLFWPESPKGQQHTSMDTGNVADALPGGNKATLTLSDGRTILLDTAHNGTLTSESGSQVIKNGGDIIYSASGDRSTPTLMHRMSTPAGGQYRLKLPDGTRVWLNASSSITYPTAFNSNTREVTITGEAYFDVAKNADQPFRVKAGAATIQVIGTSFNVNAYADEKNTNTTLVEGGVTITCHNGSQVLRPGQQLQVDHQTGSMRLILSADIRSATAWKEGVFAFQNADLQSVMRQLARWYDVKVEYRNSNPQGTFSGEISRELTLAQVLKGLTKTRINYTIDGKKLIILP